MSDGLLFCLHLRATAQTPTKQRPYGYRGLPALAFALHGWQRMLGFKAFHSAQATIAGIETAHMIRKGQLSEEYIPAYKKFMALAG